MVKKCLWGGLVLGGLALGLCNDSIQWQLWKLGLFPKDDYEILTDYRAPEHLRGQHISELQLDRAVYPVDEVAGTYVAMWFRESGKHQYIPEAKLWECGGGGAIITGSDDEIIDIGIVKGY